MGGQHANNNATSVYRCIHVRGGPTHARIGPTRGPGGAGDRIFDNVRYRWRSEQQQVESQARTRQAVRAEEDELTTRLKGEHEMLRKEQDG